MTFPALLLCWVNLRSSLNEVNWRDARGTSGTGDLTRGGDLLLQTVPLPASTHAAGPSSLTMACVLFSDPGSDEELWEDTHSLHGQLSPISMCGWYRTNQALFDLSPIVGDFTKSSSVALSCSGWKGL